MPPLTEMPGRFFCQCLIFRCAWLLPLISAPWHKMPVADRQVADGHAGIFGSRHGLSHCASAGISLVLSLPADQ